MKNDTLYSFSFSASYAPEDDKLRLYVGRVPRDEYEALIAEGWESTPKQSEAGGGEFAATWTPEREDTALSYAGEIDDEDMSPADRAALRAERFADYTDRNLDRATTHGDRYDAGPSAHGFQSRARAIRAADRHDRQAGRAVTHWDRAEYWQQRTAGVIKHALYRSAPGVRMGRIKTLESKLRKIIKDGTEYRKDYNPDASRWVRHLRHRIAYETQMLEAQGGRAASLNMEKGGTLGGKVIAKVNKSTATGRVVSVHVITDRVSGWHYRVDNVEGTPYALAQFKTERLAPGAYQPPTPESLATLAAFETARKAKQAAAPKAPALVNPTLADAQRLQAILNSRKTAPSYDKDHKPSEVWEMTQAEYSANSGGTYSRLETFKLCAMGKPEAGGYKSEVANARLGPVICKLRMGSGGGLYNARRVIVITDKPQRDLPPAMFQHYACPDTPETLAPLAREIGQAIAELRSNDTVEARALIHRAEVAGLVGSNGHYLYHWTEAGHAWHRKHAPELYRVTV